MVCALDVHPMRCGSCYDVSYVHLSTSDCEKVIATFIFLQLESLQSTSNILNIYMNKGITKIGLFLQTAKKFEIIFRSNNTFRVLYRTVFYLFSLRTLDKFS